MIICILYIQIIMKNQYDDKLSQIITLYLIGSTRNTKEKTGRKRFIVYSIFSICESENGLNTEYFIILLETLMAPNEYISRICLPRDNTK